VNHCDILREIVEAAEKWKLIVKAEQAKLKVVLLLMSLVVLASATA
jgi:hypothetical protein